MAQAYAVAIGVFKSADGPQAPGLGHRDVALMLGNPWKPMTLPT
jgi:hypothetical protein